MKGIDKTILTLVSLSLSFMAAAAFLLWLTERRDDLGFAPSIALSALVGLVAPLAAVIAIHRLRPTWSAGWLFAVYIVVCAALIAAFGPGIE